jgi:acetyl esterase
MPLYPRYTQGKLDPQAEALLIQSKEGNSTPLASLTPQQARQEFLEKSWLGTPKSTITTKNRTISGSIPIRVYQPEENRIYPILIFFHGGGFVLGALDEFDPFCKFLADGAQCIVVSVDYRLAPEHKYPAAVDDALAATQWVIANAAELGGDPARVAVAGDSAGANLAAVTSIRLRGALMYQVLICPWLDLSSTDTESYHYFGDGSWLSTASIQWYRSHYLQHQEQAWHYSVSPLLAEDLNGLPPAFVVTAEFDVLRDEGEAYAHRLSKAGVQAHCARYPGMLHDFVILPGLFDRAQNAIDEICQRLSAAFTH